MGGSGSGNWYRWDSKGTTEGQHRIDVRVLKKWGHLNCHLSFGTWSWTRNGESSGKVDYRVDPNGIVLNYRFRQYGGEWESVEQRITFDRTTCNFGGNRVWFLCPRCNQRVVVLYGAGKYFWCRHCYDLTYASQQECKVYRLMRKARKIRKRLGASMDLMAPILFKPKNMHQKTFDRLRREAEHANNLSWLIMGQRLGIKI